MKIVHLMLTSRFAGSERYAVELANHQAQRHEVVIVLRKAACESRADGIARRVDARVKLVVVPNWFSAWHAARALRELKPEIAHAHLSAGCKALKRVRKVCPGVATLHLRYKRRQHAGLDGLIAIAPWQIDGVPAGLRERTVVVDNWTRSMHIDPAARSRLRRAHGIPEDAYLIGSVGRLESIKGYDLLSAAFAKLDDRDAWLAVVGSGGRMKSLQANAPRNAIFPGFSDRPEDWYSAFDAFVSSSRSEAFGLALLEAMQAGLPILATQTQGARYLADMIDTPLMPIDDVQAMTDALSALVKDAPSRRGYDMSRFRVEDAGERIEAFYNQVIQRSRNQRTDSGSPGIESIRATAGDGN